MIRSRKEMNEYIRQDMKRNLVSGGGKIQDSNIVESPIAFHGESKAL